MTETVCQIVQKMSFAEAWAKANPDSSRNFVEGVFWETLYPHARFFARFIFPIWQGYFANDLEMIQRIGTATSVREVRLEIDNCRYQHREFGLLRKLFKIRVSGRRLVSLAYEVMHQEPDDAQ